MANANANRSALCRIPRGEHGRLLDPRDDRHRVRTDRPTCPKTGGLDAALGRGIPSFHACRPDRRRVAAWGVGRISTFRPAGEQLAVGAQECEVEQAVAGCQVAIERREILRCHAGGGHATEVAAGTRPTNAHVEERFTRRAAGEDLGDERSGPALKVMAKRSAI